MATHPGSSSRSSIPIRRSTTISADTGALRAVGLSNRPSVVFLSGSVTAMNSVWGAYGVRIAVGAKPGEVSHNNALYFITPNGYLADYAVPFGTEDTTGRYSLDPSSLRLYALAIAETGRESRLVAAICPASRRCPFDPASMSTSSLGIAKAVWFRRPWFLAALALLVVVAISVVIDLPRPITRAQDVASQNSSIDEINTDLADCTFAAKESFNFYNENLAGQLTKSDLAEVPTLLTGDETACSFASEPVVRPDQQPGSGRHRGGQVRRPHGDRRRGLDDRLRPRLDRRHSVPLQPPGRRGEDSRSRNAGDGPASNRSWPIHDEKSADEILGVRLVPVAIPPTPPLDGHVVHAGDRGVGQIDVGSSNRSEVVSTLQWRASAPAPSVSRHQWVRALADHRDRVRHSRQPPARRRYRPGAHAW